MLEQLEHRLALSLMCPPLRGPAQGEGGRERGGGGGGGVQIMKIAAHSNTNSHLWLAWPQGQIVRRVAIMRLDRHT